MIKKILIIFVLISSTCLYTCAQKDKSNFLLNIHIDQTISEVEQWVYLYSLVYNETTPIDSCKLEIGNTLISISGNIPEIRECKLLFSRKGTYLHITILPDDTLTIKVTEKMKMRSRIGYPATDEMVDVFEVDSWPLKRNIDKLNSKLSLINDSTSFDYQILKDSIKFYNNQILNNYSERINRTKYPTVAITCLDFLQEKIPYDSIFELTKKVKNRFPSNNQVQMYWNYVNGTPFPKQTNNSYEFSKRMQKIILDKKDPLINRLIASRNQSMNIQQIIPFKMGDIIDNINLIGLNNDNVSLNSIKSPYILIDFWASWCKPCREESPYLKKIIKKYQEKLTVYAISIDETKDFWKKAIINDKTEDFTHTYIGNYNEKSELLLKKFGIKAIPANFLLDKDRKIIAVNLRGEELEKKMEELLSEEKIK